MIVAKRLPAVAATMFLAAVLAWLDPDYIGVVAIILFIMPFCLLPTAEESCRSGDSDWGGNW